jgi:hypothetical protein
MYSFWLVADYRLLWKVMHPDLRYPGCWHTLLWEDVPNSLLCKCFQHELSPQPKSKLTWLADVISCILLYTFANAHCCSPCLEGMPLDLFSWLGWCQRGSLGYFLQLYSIAGSCRIPIISCPFLKCNKMLVVLRLASIDFILFDTVQLVWNCAALVVVNHIPLSKESRCCAARFCLFVPMQYEGITCPIPLPVPIFIGLCQNPGLVYVYSLNYVYVSARRCRYFNSKTN